VSRCLLIGLLVSLAGCTAGDGDVLRKIARKTGEKLHDTAGPLAAGSRAVPAAALRADVAVRVEVRLLWDRYLADAGIEVRSEGKGAIVLTGQVADPSIKSRAVELAKSTVGVERVTDQIKLVKDE
jgi:osmotically-inducible protein OsmY